MCPRLCTHAGLTRASRVPHARLTRALRAPQVVHEASGLPFKSVDFAVPEVFVGGLLGGMLVFVFAGLCCQAVGKCAADVVQEVRLRPCAPWAATLCAPGCDPARPRLRPCAPQVRRQFAEKPGIIDGSQLPDYSKCVSIVAAASLKEMRKPGLLALGLPVFVGFFFRVLGGLQGKPLLGPMVLAGMLITATICGTPP